MVSFDFCCIQHRQTDKYTCKLQCKQASGQTAIDAIGITNTLRTVALNLITHTQFESYNISSLFIYFVLFFFSFAEGVFIARGKEDALVTRNLVPGSEVYGEKRISVEVS